MLFLNDGIDTDYGSTNQCPDGDRKSENGIRHVLSFLMKTNVLLNRYECIEMRMMRSMND